MNDPLSCPYCGKLLKDKELRQYDCATFLHDSPKGDHRGYDCVLTQLAQQTTLLRRALEVMEIVSNAPASYSGADNTGRLYGHLLLQLGMATVAQILAPDLRAALGEKP